MHFIRSYVITEHAIRNLWQQTFQEFSHILVLMQRAVYAVEPMLENKLMMYA